MLAELSGKRVLLLQGPIGPFFRRFAQDLRAAGAEVHKLNFNLGDVLFYPSGHAYRGDLRGFEAFLTGFIDRLGIDACFLFGDGRPLHRVAVQVARAKGVAIYVLEEGYLRPDFVTIERDGVNGFSSLPRTAAPYLEFAEHHPRPESPRAVGPTFGRAGWLATFYVIVMGLGWPLFPRYQHHKPFRTFSEAFYWVRGGLRKLRNRRRDRPAQARLTGELSGRYFLVPLQVHNDFQLHHSPFADVPSFMAHVVESFAKNAPPDRHLVFKHHPLDRAYRDYSLLIQQLVDAHGLRGRVLYVDEVHLPTVLEHAVGAVMINSTVGLSALYHRTPVKVLGQAIYDVEGLTYAGALDGFWSEPGQVNRHLFDAFTRYVRVTTQGNGSFYRPLPDLGTAAGVIWPARLPSAHVHGSSGVDAPAVDGQALDA